jgi:hypothetical protein
MLVVFLLLFAVSLGARAPSAPPIAPSAVRRAVDAAYPGWRFATLLPALRRQLAPGQRPEWISGDFDADGRLDYAVQLVRAAAPPDSAQLTVALLRRGAGGFALHVVKAGGVHDGIWLGRGARGARGRDVEADTDFVYRADAIEIGYGQEAGETCLLIGGTFRCLVTSD